MALSILVVDDEKIQRETLASLLSEQGYSIACAGDLKEAIHWMSQSPLDVILTDFRMPLGNGIEVAKKAAELCPQCATIIMTAYADVQSVIESMRAGVVDYLLKPLNIEQLLNKLRFLENWQHLQKERTYLRAQLNRSLDTSRLLGSSGAMVEVRRLIDRVAGTKGSVLITGESGTG
ncbi:MAG: sigma-54-dependent Fis family transcriptional regulator, partial [Deltaproteobacteria bacterium]|nr:sigma-54-dependent Fis family transcriptional regulator [Deltaproteobacteria bacterium]